MKDPIKWQKHLEVCKKYREKNREKVKNAALDSYYKRKKENPDFSKKHSETSQRYRLRNLEKIKEQEKENSRLRRLNGYGQIYMKKYLREHALRKNYNLTPEQYEQIYQKQAGKCAICNMEFTKTPHTDHCHSTQKIRGLLCGQCNLMLGMIEKGLTRNPKLLLSVAEYLK